MPISLSVAIITYNEEKKIRRCLESVAKVADEIVVVDSHSTDATVSICRQMGARVVQRDFAGHIQQKNFALSQCAHDHVLSLDGDEALDQYLQDSILKVKNDWRGKGYRFNRLTNYAGQWIYRCGWYPDTKLRLIDRRHAAWEGVNPHDILRIDDGGPGTWLKGDILHYSYASVADHISQTNALTTIAAKASFERGVRSHLGHILIRPPLKFVRDYLVKRGFLDGHYGLIICAINGLATFLKYVKIRELQKCAKDASATFSSND